MEPLGADAMIFVCGLLKAGFSFVLLAQVLYAVAADQQCHHRHRIATVA